GKPATPAVGRSRPGDFRRHAGGLRARGALAGLMGLSAGRTLAVVDVPRCGSVRICRRHWRPPGGRVPEPLAFDARFDRPHRFCNRANPVLPISRSHLQDDALTLPEEHAKRLAARPTFRLPELRTLFA